MINKQNLWFITLFSLILILGIYYVAIPEETITVLNENDNSTTVNTEITTSDSLVAMRVEEEEKLLEEMEVAQSTLLNINATSDEKNEAYELLQELNNKKGKISEFESLIKDKYNYESCVKIDGNNINITILSEDLGEKTANEIINLIQEKYENQMYITVKFQSK